LVCAATSSSTDSSIHEEIAVHGYGRKSIFSLLKSRGSTVSHYHSRAKVKHAEIEVKHAETGPLLLHHSSLAAARPPVYAEVASVEDLRRFMEDHVFAVWDFMSLLKRLQQDLTCTKVPWFPADDARAARLINDIVIGEETDVDPDGNYVSHLDL
jgi:Protein of unknown function (DUF3050)